MLFPQCQFAVIDRPAGPRVAADELKRLEIRQGWCFSGFSSLRIAGHVLEVRGKLPGWPWWKSGRLLLTHDQLDAIRRVLDRMAVWEWHAAYRLRRRGEICLDGHSWSLRVKTACRRHRSRGANAYPCSGNPRMASRSPDLLDLLVQRIADAVLLPTICERGES